MEFSYRLGSFFILVGLGALFFFWMTIQSPNTEPQGNYLVIGVASLILGIWLAWRGRPKPHDVERFTTVKKIFKRDKKKK